MNLDCIPYDVFYQIASRLGSQDLVQLGRVNGALNRLVQDESIARKAIEVLCLVVPDLYRCALTALE